MAHSFVCVYLHLVFSTKERLPLIPTEKLKPLERYIAGILRNHGMKALAVGGMLDHMHVLVSLSAEPGVAKVVNLVKANSSRWMREENRKFAWQEGYAAFSVSASALDAVARYVKNQAEHHKRRGFREEYLALLLKHGVEYDPRWVC